MKDRFTPLVPLVPVRSSSLAAVGYSSDANALLIEFNNGSVYCYLGVPWHEHEQLMNSDSLGRHFNQAIRPNYSYERLDT